MAGQLGEQRVPWVVGLCGGGDRIHRRPEGVGVGRAAKRGWHGRDAKRSATKILDSEAKRIE